MTGNQMDCERFETRASEYIDADLDAASREELDAHAERCESCASLLADLRRIAEGAGTLPVLVPSRDLWPGIRARIETPVVELGGESGSGRRGWFVSTRWVTAAAAALVVTTAGITYIVAAGAGSNSGTVASVDSADSPNAAAGTGTAAGAAATPLVASDDAPEAAARTNRPPENPQPLPATSARSEALVASIPRDPAMRGLAAPSRIEAAYAPEIDRLRTLLLERRDQLDSATVAVLERNLQVIDAAIADSRAALARDTASAFLMQQLNSTLDMKLDLLRIAALLPART
ncbi:MAG: anti-sigma factor family protein [Gemmatimonadaceae bacterium]